MKNTLLLLFCFCALACTKKPNTTYCYYCSRYLAGYGPNTTLGKTQYDTVCEYNTTDINNFEEGYTSVGWTMTCSLK